MKIRGKVAQLKVQAYIPGTAFRKTTLLITTSNHGMHRVS